MLFLQPALQKKHSGKRTLHRPILQYLFLNAPPNLDNSTRRIALLVINRRFSKKQKLLCKCFAGAKHQGLRNAPLWGEKSCPISLFCRFYGFIYNQPSLPQSGLIYVHILCSWVSLLESAFNRFEIQNMKVVLVSLAPCSANLWSADSVKESFCKTILFIY